METKQIQKEQEKTADLMVAIWKDAQHKYVQSVTKTIKRIQERHNSGITLTLPDGEEKKFSKKEKYQAFLEVDEAKLCDLFPPEAKLLIVGRNLNKISANARKMFGKGTTIKY